MRELRLEPNVLTLMYLAILATYNKTNQKLCKLQVCLLRDRLGAHAELGTANLHSIPQPQTPQNCKRCSATANPQVRDRFAVTFRTSATANAHCTSANLDHNTYCYFVLVMTFFIFGGQTLPSTRPLPPKKKVINSRTLTSNPENKSVHFFRAVLSRNRQHCLLLCGFAVNFTFSPQIRKYLR